MVKIAPSIMAADFSRLGEEIKKLERGGADLLHFDIMNGHFVPNITMGPLVLEALRPKTRLPFAAHLMIENPDSFIEGFVKAGSNIISVHLEATIHLNRTINDIKSFGVKVGVALNPSTPLRLCEHILEDLDIVLVMTVNPGFSGQSFLMGMLSKIKRLKEIISEKGLKTEIEVDGGIDGKTAPLVVEAGADIIVAASSIFKKGKDRLKAIRELRESVEGIIKRKREEDEG